MISGSGLAQAKNDGLVSHGGDHVLVDSSGNGETEEAVSTLHAIGQASAIGFLCEFHLVFVQVGAALVNQPLGIEHEDVLVFDAQFGVEFCAGDGPGACAGNDNPDVFELLAADFHGIDQTGAGNDGRAVLVVMEDGNVHFLFQCFFNVETLGSLDVFEVDAAEGGFHCLDHFDQLVGVGNIQVQVENVYVSETLEENSLAFHDRLAGGSADVAEAENGCSVGNNSHEVAAGRVVEGLFFVSFDFLARQGNAGCVSERKMFLGGAGFDRYDLDLSLVALAVVIQRFLLGEQ